MATTISVYQIHCSFSGKEKDVETGYHYFGARYYNSDLSMWLSVDPMADKCSSLSPYNYCAWNPMKIVDPDGNVPVFFGLLQYQGKAKFGNSRSGEARMVGSFYVLPFYDNNNNLIGYNAGRERSDGRYVTEYQMSADDIDMFIQNYKQYEYAANLTYCHGEPDWEYVSFGHNFFSGNAKGILCDLGKMWTGALLDPSFYFSVAASIAITGNIGVNTNNRIRSFAKEIETWIGKDARVITNDSKDIIILSKDRKRQIRFDLNEPSPHKNPHVHLESRKTARGQWKKIRIYPKDVAPE